MIELYLVLSTEFELRMNLKTNNQSYFKSLVFIGQSLLTCTYKGIHCPMIKQHFLPHLTLKVDKVSNELLMDTAFPTTNLW